MRSFFMMNLSPQLDTEAKLKYSSLIETGLKKLAGSTLPMLNVWSLNNVLQNSLPIKYEIYLNNDKIGMRIIIIDTETPLSAETIDFLKEFLSTIESILSVFNIEEYPELLQDSSTINSQLVISLIYAVVVQNTASAPADNEG